MAARLQMSLQEAMRPVQPRGYSEMPPESPVVDTHLRRKSTSMNVNLAKLTVPASDRMMSTTKRSRGSCSDGLFDSLRSTPTRIARHDSAVSPPVSPDRLVPVSQTPDESTSILEYDFSKIDYQLERARQLGSGLWSKVYLAEPTSPEVRPSSAELPSPPITPQKCSESVAAGVYAVKVPARPGAVKVFQSEAKILTLLQTGDGAGQYIVPFFGLDPRNNALIFEAVIGGSVEDLTKRLSHMTELSRHLELVSIFPRLAQDLINGLEFIHSAGIVHADIKPANILLDISDHYSLPAPVIRARFIDFSAAFSSSTEPSPNAGGTWDYMAPEQMRIQKDLSTPTCASDVWSLGITLLSVITLGSPYTAACGSNVFMLREAIKTGDPMGFARMDAVVQKRMGAAQEFIDCCKLALLKDREKRTEAKAWRGWLDRRRFGAYAALI